MEIKVLQKALRILELASRRKNVLPGDLSEELGIPRSTCVRLLKDLTEFGYLEQISRARGYCLGPLAYFLVDGSEYLSELTGRGREILKDLAHTQKISALLAVRHDNFRVVLAGFNGDSSLQVDFSNPRCYDCHLSVSGRLLLAYSPEKERMALVKEFGVLSKGPFAGLTAVEIAHRLAAYREAGELIDPYKDRMAAALPVFRNRQVVAVLGAVWRAAGNEERFDGIVSALRKTSVQLSSCLSSFVS